MASANLVLWEVDPQRDFLLPGGNLYVPGGEKLLPNFRRLTDAAREGHAFLVSHGCYHTPDDPEFKMFPPHCVKGTPGSEFVTEAMADRPLRIPNEPAAAIPVNLSLFHQVILEKQTLDIFESRHADSLLRRFPPNTEFAVFGVVTEYCVRLAAKGLLERGRPVWLVQDAIETLNPDEGRRALAELQTLGAGLTTTDEVLARLHQPA
jgi:nicotinamidase/pyrazinamidase